MFVDKIQFDICVSIRMALLELPWSSCASWQEDIDLSVPHTTPLLKMNSPSIGKTCKCAYTNY